MQNKDLIGLVLMLVGIGGGIICACLSQRVRDLLFMGMVFLAPMTEDFDINFVSRDFYRGTTRGFEFSIVDILSISVVLASLLRPRQGESRLYWPASLGFIQGYSKGRTPAERLEVVKLFVGLGADVNDADDYGITPLMVAGNMGDTKIISYLVDVGADLGAYDLGKKNDGAFGASVEPLMPVDYAIGVGTFVPNNAIILHEEAAALMARLMKEKGIKHTTSECTLRGFTCAQANVDPKVATPAEIARIRAIQIGHQVEGITGGLEVKDQK